MVRELIMKRSILALLSVLSFACVDHSKTDPRIFHCEVLDNGLTVLLVEDPKATESAAAMYVDVGSQDNPKNRDGLAHFLEHMLFITTEEYPEVDSLSEYVASHGGSYNAFTAGDHTQYYFSVKPEYFEKGFDIFSAFFISPLFEEKYVDRERHAVHSEFIVSKQSDDWRMYHLGKTLLSRHPANRFSTGNLDTLGIEGLRQDLIDFYDSHYSSDRMNFVAVVPKGSDDLFPVIKARLEKIKKRETIPQDLSPRIASYNLGRFVKYKPIDDIDLLKIEFALPSSKKEFLKHTGKYLSTLIADESSGSIIDTLRKLDLATQLDCGIDEFSETEDLFIIEVKLTDDGVKRLDEVMSVITSYIDLATKEGIKKSYLDEMQKISSMQYDYYTQESVLDQVNYLVGNMKDYPRHKWNNLRYVLKDTIYDPYRLKMLLKHMILSNSIVTLASKSVKTNLYEPIYGIHYATDKISQKQYKAWNKPTDLELSLPKPNTYIPDKVEMLSLRDTQEPEQLSEESWYKVGQFEQPKQFLAFSKVSPVESPEDSAVLMLTTRLLRLEKLGKLYPAIKAGSSISINHDEKGINLVVGGMGDKQSMILNKMITLLYGLQNVSEHQFSQVKEEILQDLYNMRNMKPYMLVNYHLATILEPGKFHYKTIEKEIKGITRKDYIRSLKGFLIEGIGQRFYYGNIAKSDVKTLHQEIEIESKPVILEKGEEVVKIESTRDDNAAIVYFQMDGDSYYDKVCASLISSMIRPLMFKQLRTEEQMGYIVFSTYKEHDNRPGIGFVIQSPHIPSDAIRKRILSFLKEGDFWDEDVFSTVKASMILQLEKPFQSMSEEFSFYWDEIHSGRFDYHKKRKMISVLEDLTIEDLEEYYNKMLEEPRQLSILTY